MLLPMDMSKDRKTKSCSSNIDCHCLVCTNKSISIPLIRRVYPKLIVERMQPDEKEDKKLFVEVE